MKRLKELRRKVVEKEDWEAVKPESFMRRDWRVTRRKSQGNLDQAKEVAKCMEWQRYSKVHSAPS